MVSRLLMMCGAVVTAAAAYIYKSNRSVESTPINVQLAPEPIAMAATSGMLRRCRWVLIK